MLLRRAKYLQLKRNWEYKSLFDHIDTNLEPTVGEYFCVRIFVTCKKKISKYLHLVSYINKWHVVSGILPRFI